MLKLCRIYNFDIILEEIELNIHNNYMVYNLTLYIFIFILKRIFL